MYVCLLVTQETYEIKIYNFYFGFVWVQNLISHIKGRTQAVWDSEQGAEGHVWTYGEEVTAGQ